MPQTMHSTGSAILTRVRSQPSRLRVAREDILFVNTRPDVVQLAVTVRNDADTPSEPAVMHVGATSFGAFLPSEPVVRLQVPTIAAGGLTVVHAEFADPRHHTGSGLPRLPRSEEAPRTQAERRAHWPGGFDVCIGRATAARNCARAVELRAGRQNFAVFKVGDRTDAYRFSFRGDGADWSPILMAPRRGEVPADGSWVKLHPGTPMGVQVVAPKDVVEGQLGVRIEQRSSGRVALVELGFGSETLPPRCFAPLD